MKSAVIDKTNQPNAQLNSLNKKNYCAIDIAKLVSAILVMFIHYADLFPNKWAKVLVVGDICSYAVPFFFISSAFFLFRKLTFKNGKLEKSKDNFKTFLKYELRLIILYGIWSVIYGVLRYYEYIKTGGGYNFFKDYIISTVLSKSYYHLWYLLSIIVAIPFIYLVLRFIKVKYALILSAILYVGGAIAFSYFWLPGVSAYVELYNASKIFGLALLRALPLMVVSLLFICFKPVSKKLSIGLLVLFVVLNTAEILLISLYTENSGFYGFVFTTLPLAICVFAVISNINIPVSKKACSYIRRTSTIIYCVHPLVYYFITPIALPSPWINFAISLAICVAFSLLLIWLSDLKHGKVLKYLY